jgi:hypothetical protein
MMKTIDDEELVELEIEGGSCWIPDVAGPIDQVLWGPRFRLCN